MQPTRYVSRLGRHSALCTELFICAIKSVAFFLVFLIVPSRTELVTWFHFLTFISKVTNALIQFRSYLEQN